ncbi:hypothetical protein [Citrobacter braakii]|uniref:hypothetical protein n=1 Tax=Citrobacter braakii TaxID=57706 RepID=UPI0011EE44C6|nr:hypothetical protein [Citrobacter braakii]
MTALNKQALQTERENSLHRLAKNNRENQRTVTVNVGVLKTAIREINAHVAVNGKGIMTDMTLNALRAAAGIGVKGE